MNVITKSIVLLGAQRTRLPFIGALFVFMTAVDVLGVGLIGPLVSLVIDVDLQKHLTEVIFKHTNIEFDNQSVLFVVGISLICFYIMRFFLAVWANAVIVSFGEANRKRLKMILLKVYQDMPSEVSSERNTAEYIQSIHTLSGHFTSNVLNYMLKFVSESLVFVFIFIFLAYQSFGVVISLMCLLTVTAVLWDLFSRRRIKKAGKNINHYSSEALSHLRENLDGVSEIRILGKIKMFLDRFEENSEELQKNQKYAAILNSIPKYLLELIILVFVVFICTFSFLFTNNLAEFVPVLAVFAMAAVRLLPGATILMTALVVIRHNTNTVNILYDDYNRSLLDDKNLHVDYEKDIGKFDELEIRDLSFGFTNGSKNILTDVCLKVRAGESIGIVGQSGSGKSTLANLILGLLHVKKGAILINGIPISKCLKSWQSHLAIIPQELFLLDSSVAVNVALEFDENKIDKKKLDNALEMASIKEFVKSLPSGINSSIGEHGTFLSGGQRQRLILARAFYHNRDFLIMDEATSALDSATEEKIIAEITSLKTKITMVVIAHRRSTIEHCDHVFEIVDGKIHNHK